MRVIAGRFRGRRLAAAPDSSIRPTSDRAREALFNVLMHGRYGSGGTGVVAGAHVLDVFAGTGALGIEALSRGAAHATFIENDEAALRILRRNLKPLDVADAAAIVRADAIHPPRATGPHDLVLMDPPYHSGAAGPALLALRAQGWLSGGALVVIEFAAREAFDLPDGFALVEERRYGAARLVFLRAP